MTTVPTAASPLRTTDSRSESRTVVDHNTVTLVRMLAALAVATSAVGLLVPGGPGPHDVVTARGADVTLYGHGLYAADSWLVGAGNRGQDVAVLLFEVPLLLAALGWQRRRPSEPLAGVAVTGVLAFFTYYGVSMVFGAAQNRLFPAYVAAAAVAGFALARAASRLDTAWLRRSVPAAPLRRALVGYLGCVAVALVAAWAPPMVGATVTGEIADAVGPYTSSVTQALDLGVVVPIAVLAAVRLWRGRASGFALTLVLLVVNVCIGGVLLAQGAAQLLAGVPLTPGEIVGKSLSFLVLTVAAGALLARIAATSSAAPSTVPVEGPSRGRSS
jgi:hypothetical protein